MSRYRLEQNKIAFTAKGLFKETLSSSKIVEVTSIHSIYQGGCKAYMLPLASLSANCSLCASDYIIYSWAVL